MKDGKVCFTTRSLLASIPFKGLAISQSKCKVDYCSVMKADTSRGLCHIQMDRNSKHLRLLINMPSQSGQKPLTSVSDSIGMN